jgi:DNA-binding MarR family transcriptional regulator
MTTRKERSRACIANHLDAHRGEKGVAESILRKTYGNTPDISKAIRDLFDIGYLTREGKGGKHSPFLYSLTPTGLQYAKALREEIEIAKFMTSM